MGKTKSIIGLVMVVTPVTLFATQVSAASLPIIFTHSADFLQGDLINLEVLPDSTNHHLKLIDKGEAFNFIWVAVSSKGTVVKIDTRTGEVLGEYKTAPDGMGTNPSRTTVDADGNVWVGNRAEGSGGLGSVTKIGLAENGQCRGTNTSNGLGDILDWNNAGSVDSAGGVSTAEDDCILHYVRTPGTGIRALAIDGNNNVWTGGYGNRLHAKIDSATGLIVPGTTINYGCGGYGALIDGNGILWSGSGTPHLLRYDPVSNTSECIRLGRTSYGLGIDLNGNIWQSNWCNNTIQKIDTNGNILDTFHVHGSCSRGVAVTSDNNIWIANSGSHNVTRLQNNGTLVSTIPVGSTPTGVSVDADGKVWVTNLSSNNVMRIDPNTNTVDLTVPLGAGASPYNYSDMTGSTNTAPPSQGAWTVVYDSGTALNEWNNVAITWNGEPEGTNLGLTVKACSSENGIACTSPYEDVSSGRALALPAGQYLQIQVAFKRSINGESPILSDLSIKPLAPCRTRDCVDKGTRTRR